MSKIIYCICYRQVFRKVIRHFLQSLFCNPDFYIGVTSSTLMKTEQSKKLTSYKSCLLSNYEYSQTTLRTYDPLTRLLKFWRSYSAKKVVQC